MISRVDQGFHRQTLILDASILEPRNYNCFSTCEAHATPFLTSESVIRKGLALVLFFLKSSKLSMLSSLFSFSVYDFFAICWQYAFCCFSIQVHCFFQFLLLLVVLLKDFILQNRCATVLNPCLLFLFLSSSLIVAGNNLSVY